MRELESSIRQKITRTFNRWRYRLKVYGEFEIAHRGTRHLVWEINCVTNGIETIGLMQEPVNREIVDFAQRLRNVALLAVIDKGIEGLAEFPSLTLPRAGEGGDVIEDSLAYPDIGRDNPSYWRTQIPQLWIKRDPSDPIDLPRSIVGSYAVPPDIH